MNASAPDLASDTWESTTPTPATVNTHPVQSRAKPLIPEAKIHRRFCGLFPHKAQTKKTKGRERAHHSPFSAPIIRRRRVYPLPPWFALSSLASRAENRTAPTMNSELRTKNSLTSPRRSRQSIPAAAPGSTRTAPHPAQSPAAQTSSPNAP